MKIGLICPSNLLYMPYLSNYIKVLESNKVEYIVINWDRLGIEEYSQYVFKDNKKNLRRNIYDYYKYKKFVKEIMKKEKFDRIIIFSLQLSFFLRNTILREYSQKYIIDVRDYNNIMKVYSFDKIFENASFNVLSSSRYMIWLPKKAQYYINHNMRACNKDMQNIITINKKNTNIEKEHYNISYIGAIRDCEINVELIKSLKDSKKIQLIYNGEGICRPKLQEMVSQEKINNVTFTGLYQKKEEAKLYQNADMINIVRTNESLNNRTALPNRLYNSLIYGKPFLALSGTYMSDIVKKYSLGLVVNDFANLDKMVDEYFQEFSEEEFERNTILFLNKVIEENKLFESKLFDFFNENN